MVETTLLEALVSHERLKPFNHKFRYKIFQLKFSLDHLQELQGPLFSIDKFNLFSFHSKDYLDGSQRPLKEKILEVLRPEGIKAEGEIVLQTIPRLLGYGFNPVSFWHIYDRHQKLEAIMAEVNNTFGDRHYYLMQGFDQYKNIHTKKVFHVSPFFDIEGEYQFTFNPKSVLINYFDTQEGNYFFKSTLAEFQTHRYSTRNLLMLLLKYPLMTFFIMGRIHWQALILFIKKAKFFTRPEPPKNILSKEVHR